jgi:membrane associated rhomboid family serine protease
MFFPYADENPTLRVPVVTIALLVALGVVWVFVQGAGFNEEMLVASVCNLGLVPGEITHQAAVGTGIRVSQEAVCVVDDMPINLLTPFTSMFLHGGWMHLLGNGLFLWVFGNNVEDSMGRFRFLLFYLACGLAAAAAQIMQDPSSPVPMVGASGAISGVMGAYLLLYPRVRVKVLLVIVVFLTVITVPAFMVLLAWIGLQLVSAYFSPGVGGGVAFWAHIGGFVAGALLVKVFENRRLVAERTVVRHRFHPGHP